jgi:uncharacterized membrane protein
MGLAIWRRARSHLKASLWTVPLVTIPVAMIATRLLHWLDAEISWQLLGFAVPGARGMLDAIVTATLSFLVFTFGSLLIAIQVASGQLTPRIIATTLLQDTVVRYTVGLFMFTLIFAVTIQDRLDDKVYQLPLFVVGCFALLCFAAFLYLIDHAAKLLRPISILARVATAGLAVIEDVYPDRTHGRGSSKSLRHTLPPLDRVIHHRGNSGIVLAVDVEALKAEAEKLNGAIEFVPQVGDFVAVDEPLFNLYGEARLADDHVLQSAIGFGSERTMEQDPTFAFRIVIDIALKALSPAINDPTTAVLAIDQLHRMLRSVGIRDLRTEELSDSAGQLRVIFRTPNWEDFVHLTFSEIRACGAANLQIVRRLRSMIDNLQKTLPDFRHAELQEQLSLLDREVERHFRYPEELALAQVPDSQGLGGHSGSFEQQIKPPRSS